jgi:formate dehydrogenase subunit delta
MSTSEIARLASDIAAQFAHRPDAEASISVAAHMRTFWDPRMRSQLIDLVDAGGSDLDPVVLAAAASLRADDNRT